MKADITRINDPEMLKIGISLGQKLLDAHNREFKRPVGCEICRDYHVFKVILRVVKDGKAKRKHENVRCMCGGAKKSSYHSLKTIENILDKESLQCPKCGAGVYSTKPELTRRIFIGGWVELTCKDCAESAATFEQTLEGAKARYSELTGGKLWTEGNDPKPKPKMSNSEMKKRAEALKKRLAEKRGDQA